MGEDEIALGDDPASQVARVGDTVRRPTRPWTAAVHALLGYLEEIGFDGSPRVLAADDRGREVLTYLASEPTWPYSDQALVGAAALVRRLHDALEGFVPPAGAVWHVRRASLPEYRIGHNDLGPTNTVYAAGVPYAFIDWELAGPAPLLYDLAWAAINFTPLRPDHFCRMVGFPEPPDRAGRLRVFCDTYGVEDRLALLDAIEGFEQEALREIIELGRAGVSPFNRFLRRGEDRFLRWDLEWFLAHRNQLQRAVR